MLCMHHIILNRYTRPSGGFYSWLFAPDHGGNRTTKIYLSSYSSPFSMAVYKTWNPNYWERLTTAANEQLLCHQLCDADNLLVQASDHKPAWLLQMLFLQLLLPTMLLLMLFLQLLLQMLFLQLLLWMWFFVTEFSLINSWVFYAYVGTFTNL